MAKASKRVSHTSGDKRLYFDYAATTPVRKEVLSAMLPYLKSEFGNPVSLHKEGVRAASALEEARKVVARELNAHSDEILFTSGGTEGNGLSIFGVFRERLKEVKDPGRVHMVTSAIEHPSVLDTFRYLEELGAKVSYVPVTAEGILDLKVFEESLSPDTALVSIMAVNNELGTIQPISEVGKIILKYRKVHGGLWPLFHTDASQAALYIPLDVEKIHADLLVIDGQKIYGPKGVGALFVRRGVMLTPLYFGGKQEKGLRPGTQNVPGIIGLSTAFRLSSKERGAEVKRLQDLQSLFIKTVTKMIPGAVINGSMENRLPNNVNISIPGSDSTFLALQLDARGVAVATRSACIRGGNESYVVRALGRGGDTASTSLRFSFGRDTTKRNILVALERLVKILAR